MCAGRSLFFLYLLPSYYASVPAALKHLAAMAETGFYQLYFLLVIMQFYLLFPLVLMLLRRTRGTTGSSSPPRRWPSWRSRSACTGGCCSR